MAHLLSSVAVVLLAYASAQNPPCYMCGEEACTLDNPNIVVALPSPPLPIQSLTCKQIDEFTRKGLVPPEICELTKNETYQEMCGCFCASPPCENKFTGFYLINPNVDSNHNNFKVPLPDVINLAEFPHGEINIEAEIVDYCREIDDVIKCVELSFSGYTGKERVPPYALYGDRDGNFSSGSPNVGNNQDIETCMYTNRDCSSRYKKCANVTIDVVYERKSDEDILCSECDNGYDCGICLIEVNAGRGQCPLDRDQLSDLNRHNCNGSSFLELGGEKFCESDGECNTKAHNDHDTCDNYEVYRLVNCTEGRRHLRDQMHH